MNKAKIKLIAFSPDEQGLIHQLNAFLLMIKDIYLPNTIFYQPMDLQIKV